MADSAASTQSRTPRAGSKKRRANTVSTETENKLARAARSAQRLAQLSDASRDDSTLDMFPDDPTRATLEAMNIDIRQGTLHGFELPDVVLAAVGAATSLEGAASTSSEARAARRAPRERTEAAYAAVPLAGFERIEPTQKVSAPKDLSSDAAGAGGVVPEVVDVADGQAARVGDSQQTSPAVSSTLVSPSMAAASLVRSVTARRPSGDSSFSPTVPATSIATTTPTSTADNSKPAALPSQRIAASFAKPATASSETADVNGEALDRASTGPTTEEAKPLPNDAAGLSTPPASAPELDRARATAFADTVDALYGVISDQRHAATDHTRRMKWMLSIVVGALLMTVAIGITQTVLLMRLTRETTAQQHRIEQLMQNEQTAMTSLLDAHLAMANPVAGAASTAAAPIATPPPAVATAAPAAAPASKRKAHTHAHKPKALPAAH
jgi:hypothetical protein